MSLYKYVTPARADILKYSCIRFTPPGEFNDPFEMRPVFEHLGTESGMKELYQELRAKSLTLADTNDELEREINQHFVEHFTSMIENIREYLNEAYLSTRYDFAGILSLTEKCDNLLMWAHYAQHHRGFVIEFNEQHKYFCHTDPSEYRTKGVYKVQYSLERPYKKSARDLTFQETYLVKSKEWEYEQEWRMAKMLWDADWVINTPLGLVHLFSIPIECITGVIFGCQMSEAHAKEIASLLTSNEQYSHIKTLQAVINKRRFSLDIVPSEI